MGDGLRVAVLGHGSIGRRHAGNLLADGHSVVAFDPARDDWLTGVERAPSVASALSGADAAVVASPSSMHAAHAREALQAGVPALVEKPLGLDAREARELEELALERGVPLGVAMNLRFHPGVLAVRAALPRIGRVLRASAWCGSWLPGWRPSADYRTSYSARRELGGGVLLDAIHEIDYLTWLLGPVAAVSATLPTVSDLELDVEDVALLLLETAGGAVATVTLDYVDRGYHRGCRIVGSDGTVAWDWTAERVSVIGPDGAEEHVAAPGGATPTYPAELRHFLDAVAHGTSPAVGPEAGRHALEVVDAARAAAAERRWIAVGGPDVRLRPATEDDAERLLNWRNDPVTREAAFQQAVIGLEEHRTWLASKLADPRSALLIAEHAGRPVGQVRLDLVGDGVAEVSIAVAPADRGRGVARAAIVQARREAADRLGARRLVARIKAHNEASLRAFRAAGFTEAEPQRDVVVLRADAG